MKTSLPRPHDAKTGLLTVVAALLLGLFAPGEAPAQTRPEAADLLRQSAASLATEPSFQAEFRQRVQLLERTMVGKGVYRQATHRNLRKYQLKVTLRVDDESSSLLQVSNGRFLWIRRDYPGRREIERMDLSEIRTAVRAHAEASEQPSAAGQGDGIPWIGLEGLPSTLAGLADRFTFAPLKETTIGDEPAWLLEGRWRPEVLKRLAPNFSPDDRHLNRLPPHLPTHLQLVLSRSPQWPLFPYRIEYRRAQETYQDSLASTKAIVTMEFSNVLRQAPFDAQQFEFPPDATERDVTSEVIERLVSIER